MPTSRNILAAAALAVALAFAAPPVTARVSGGGPDIPNGLSLSGLAGGQSIVGGSASVTVQLQR
jgi:hypothetical protein